MLGIEMQQARRAHLRRVDRVGRQREAGIAQRPDVALAAAALDRDPRRARAQARERSHAGQIDPRLPQGLEHAPGGVIVAHRARVGAAQPESRAGQHGRGHLAPRQDERVRRIAGLGSGRRAVDEDDPIERVLADPEDVEAPLVAEGRPERIGIGSEAQYRTR
jgi:hypothetical protein